jgi:protein-S-isoprenylcysteine O-methyltransferase Ste14
LLSFYLFVKKALKGLKKTFLAGFLSFNPFILFVIFALKTGIVLLFPQRAVCAAALGPVCYLPAGIYREERKLLQQFGAAYADYRKRVKRVIPGIW